MSETVKLIIEIPKGLYEMCKKYELCTYDSETLAIAHGIPLDTVKDKILGYNVRQHVSGSESFLRGYALGMDKSAEILDNIGKAESEET